MGFNREVVLIPNLQDGVAYTTFLNRLLPRRFKFSLAECKVVTLAKALWRAEHFIQATKICIGDDFVQPENRKKGGEDSSPPIGKRPWKDDKRIRCFHTMPVILSRRLRVAPC